MRQLGVGGSYDVQSHSRSSELNLQVVMNAGKLSFYSELLALLWTWIEELVLTELIGTHAEGQELTVQGQQNFSVD